MTERRLMLRVDGVLEPWMPVSEHTRTVYERAREMSRAERAEFLEEIYDLRRKLARATDASEAKEAAA